MNDKILIATGSYNRPYEFEKHTLFWLKQLTHYHYVVSVEPQQKVHYSMMVPPKNLITSSTGCYLCGQLMRLKQYAKENGFKYVLKVDDDTWFTDRDNTKKADSAIVIERHLDELLPVLERNPDIGVVGFLNMRDVLYNKDRRRFVRANRCLISSYLIDVDCWDYPHKIWGFDDDWVAMHVPRHFKREIAIYGRMGFNYKYETNKGGLQSNGGLEGRHALAVEDERMMRSTYPELARKIKDPNDPIAIYFEVSSVIGPSRPVPKDHPWNQ